MDRLAEQSVWNGTLWNLGWDAQTETALREWGVDEFFEGLPAVFPYEDGGPLKASNLLVFTAEEREDMTILVAILNEAWDNNSQLSGEAFINSHGASKIAAQMRQAIGVMEKRGGFFSTVREDLALKSAHA